MSSKLDWPRYSRWTWIIALLLAVLLLWVWFAGSGPGSSAACCGAPAASTSAAPAVSTSSSATVAEPATVVTLWDGNKVSLEGVVGSDAIKKTLADAAVAKYGADNVVDKLAVNVKASGPLAVTLLGNAPSDAVKAARAEEAKAIYTGASIDNQLTLVAAPAAMPKDVQCSDKVAVAATFTTGSANLTADTKKLLDAVVPCITGRFEVGGHTDNVGQAAGNQALSERRAQSVLAYLVSKGVDAKMVTAKGYGDTAPIGDNAAAQGKAKNRRIEFKKM